MLNSLPLVAGYQTAGTVPPPQPPSERSPYLLPAAGCGGLLLLLLVGGVVLRGRSKRAAARPKPVRAPAAPPTAAPPPKAKSGGRASAKAPDGRQLVVVEGPGAGQRFPLGAPAHLGRSPENDVHFGDEQASRRHALIERRGDGYEISDLGSRNGASVNGARIDRPIHLREADTFLIGNTALRPVRGGDEPTPAL